MENIQNGNRMIVEFMVGIVRADLTVQNYSKIGIPDWAFKPYNFDTLKIGGYEYHSSWDWLMPVVEKIDQGARVEIYGKACKISQPKYSPFDITHINEHKIMATWFCVVEFIQKASGYSEMIGLMRD